MKRGKLWEDNRLEFSKTEERHQITDSGNSVKFKKRKYKENYPCITVKQRQKNKQHSQWQHRRSYFYMFFIITTLKVQLTSQQKSRKKEFNGLIQSTKNKTSYQTL